jgi:hypothetical protein
MDIIAFLDGDLVVCVCTVISSMALVISFHCYGHSLDGVLDISSNVASCVTHLDLDMMLEVVDFVSFSHSICIV